MLRILFLLIFIAGGAAGIGYPWAAANLSGYEIGTWIVYDRLAGFTPAEENLAPADAPLFLTIELATSGPLTAAEKSAPLTLTVNNAGRTIFARILDFSSATARTANPQTGEQVYRLDRMQPHELSKIDSGRYSFIFGEGEASPDRISTARLTINAGGFDLDPRAVPAGFVLMAVGAVGFLMSLRRKPPANPNSSPPAPRWGRDA